MGAMERLRRQLSLRSSITWWLILLFVGVLTVVINLRAAKPCAGCDYPDLPFLAPSLAVLTVLSALAGWWSPGLSFGWGLVAMVPWYVEYAREVVADYADGSSQGLWSIGAILLVMFTVVPGYAAFGATELRRARERRRVERSGARRPLAGAVQRVRKVLTDPNDVKCPTPTDG